MDTGRGYYVSILFKQGILLKLPATAASEFTTIDMFQSFLNKAYYSNMHLAANISLFWVSILFKQGILLKQKYCLARMGARYSVSILFKQGILLKHHIFRGLLNCQRTKITIWINRIMLQTVIILHFMSPSYFSPVKFRKSTWFYD